MIPDPDDTQNDYSDENQEAPGLLDNGDPANPADPTPGGLTHIDPADIPGSEDLGGDGA